MLRHTAPKARTWMLSALVALIAVLALTATAQASNVAPVFVDGNPTCADLGYAGGSFKVDPPKQGVNTYAFGGLQVQVTVTGTNVDWKIVSGTGATIDAFIVKGGPNANVYAYGTGGATSDTGTHPPFNPNGKTAPDRYYGLSHIDFCFTPATTGTIVIEKRTNPEGLSGTFGFSSLGGLDTDGNGFTLAAGASHTYSGVPQGTYAISENATTGWDLENLVCTDPSKDTTTAAGTATIKLAAGETVRCVYTNAPTPPPTKATVIIKKVTDPKGSTDTFTFTAPGLTTGGIPLKDGQSATYADVDPATYAIDEADAPGWKLDGVSCVDIAADDAVVSSGGTPQHDANVAVQAGQIVECTFTNKAVTPPPGKATVIIRKVTDPKGSTDTFTFTAPGLTTGGIPLTDGQSATFADVDPATYTIDEAKSAAWSLQGVSCIDTAAEGAPVSSGGVPQHDASITVAADQVVECTFTNKAVPPPPTTGTIAITKLVQPAGATDTFGFTATNGLTPGFALAGGQTKIVTGVKPGSYAVTEAVTAGWTLDGITCTENGSPAQGNVAPVISGPTATLDVAAGEAISCTYRNTRVTPPGGDSSPTTGAAGGVSPVKVSGGTANRAVLRGPLGCAASRYRLTISGRNVRKVTVYVNGRRVRTVTVTTGQNRITIPVRSSGSRVQRIRAVVRFRNGASKTLRTTTLRCNVRGVSPQFTG